MRILTSLFLVISFINFAQIDPEHLEKIEAEYGEQWSFCECVVAQDSLSKAVMAPNLSDEQFDAIVVAMDSVDVRCQAFLVTSAHTTAEERYEHARKVKDCLRRYSLPVESRFRYTNPDYMGELIEAKPLELHTELIKAEFYTRLHSQLDVEPVIIYGGYEFHIVDQRTGLKFKLRLNHDNFSYWAPDRSESTMEIIDLYHSYLFDTFDALVKGYTEFETDNGHFTCGFMGGEFFEEYD